MNAKKKALTISAHTTLAFGARDGSCFEMPDSACFPGKNNYVGFLYCTKPAWDADDAEKRRLFLVLSAPISVFSISIKPCTIEMWGYYLCVIRDGKTSVYG